MKIKWKLPNIIRENICCKKTTLFPKNKNNKIKNNYYDQNYLNRDL